MPNHQACLKRAHQLKCACHLEIKFCGVVGDNNQQGRGRSSSGNAVVGGAGGDGGDFNGNFANGGDDNSGDLSGNGGIAVGDNGNGGDGGNAVGGEPSFHCETSVMC